MEKERKRSEKERKKKEEEGVEDADYDEQYDGVLCLNEREWERYRESDVWNLPFPSGRGKKSCMSKEEWMKRHDAFAYR